MRLRNWFRPPRHVLAIFLAVAVVSAGALGWLAWLLLEQDRALELQRRQERLERVADRAVAVMQSALADLELRLGSAQVTLPPPGILMVSLGSGNVVARPEGSLLYYPEPARLREAPLAGFAETEQIEFGRKDLAAAAARYARWAADPDPGVRAAALTRLARVRRKLQDPEGALRAYDQLSRISGVSVAGIPAGLVAREGRASTFEENGRTSDLRGEAAALDDDLSRGRWQIVKSEYEFHRSQVRAWFERTGFEKAGVEKTGSSKPSADDPDAVARAEAVAWLWENRSSAEPAARRLIQVMIQSRSFPALVLWNTSAHGLMAAVSGPNYLDSLGREAFPDRDLHWALSDFEGRTVAGALTPSRLAVIRAGSAAKLPWNLQVFPASGATPAAASPRRRLLLWVLAVLAVVWCTGAWFIMRAISRERRVARLQSDFVAAVSHEFRSPLSSLAQISEMLELDRFPSDALRRKSYGVLARETTRLRLLVEGLLDFQRFEADAAIYRFEPVEICGLLRALVADFQDRVASDGYTVELNGLDQEMDAEIHLRADREALSRAIWNLLDNAVKYSPECRTVWVDLEHSRNRVVIVVRDRGLGIPLNEQREIFDKFVRGADSKARRIKGTGIGLAMVRHILRAHGGEILLSSEPGQGSRFTIVLDGVLDASGGAS